MPVTVINEGVSYNVHHASYIIIQNVVSELHFATILIYNIALCTHVNFVITYNSVYSNELFA